MTRRYLHLVALTALTVACSSGSSSSTATPTTSSGVESTIGVVRSRPLDTGGGVATTIAESVRQPCAVGAAAVVTKFLQAIDQGDTPAYRRCEWVTQGQERIDGLRHGGWNLDAIRNQDATAGVVRFDLKSPQQPDETFMSNGSVVHALVPQSGTVITVSRERGGGYDVTNVEFYSSM
jgi:hypothetical protein